MQPWQILTISVAAALILGAVAVFFILRRRHANFVRGNNPTVTEPSDWNQPEAGDRIHSEPDGRIHSEPASPYREARLHRLQIQPLSAADRQRFSEEWRSCQAQFVDDPGESVQRADRLVADIMHTRSYSVNDPDERISDVSAAYPRQANGYREACDIVRHHHPSGASIKDLRRAFIHYRALFDELLGEEAEELKRAS
jgi:hypothetical protein